MGAKKLQLEKMTHPLAVEAFDKLEEGLIMFGTYTFNDKGPGEVMDLNELVTKFRSAGAAEALAAMKEMVEDDYGSSLVSSLLCNLQEWDELMELDEEFISEHM